MNKTLNIAIAGLGTVGAETFRIIDKQRELIRSRSGVDINIVAVSARDRGKKRNIDISNVAWFQDCRDLANLEDLDIVIELIGGSEGEAKELVEQAILNRKSVITANKALIANYGTEISKLVATKNVAFGYEAAVAGGIPIIKTVREGLSGNRIDRIYGILNGTCNYILSVMRETGRGFEEVLVEAQELGYAEADPAFDVDGVDAAHKLSILTAIAFQTPINFPAVHTEGIRFISPIDIEFATELGYRIKLLAIAERSSNGGVQQRVRPCLVSMATPIAQVEGVFNAVAAEAEGLGTSLSYGRGAGAGPTTSAVIADLIDIAAGRKYYMFGVDDNDLIETSNTQLENLSGSYYLRLQVFDRPGVLADLTAIFRDESVSVEALLQRGRNPDGTVPVVLTTHETNEAAIHRSVQRFKGLKSVVEDPRILPIEIF